MNTFASKQLNFNKIYIIGNLNKGKKAPKTTDQYVHSLATDVLEK